jgi:hypothetical protein
VYWVLLIPKWVFPLTNKYKLTIFYSIFFPNKPMYLVNYYIRLVQWKEIPISMLYHTHPTNKKAPVRRMFEPEAFHLPLMPILFEPVLDTFMSQSGCFLVVNKGFIKIAIIISISQVDVGPINIRI